MLLPSNNTSFTDVIFNLALGFIVLLFLVIFLINPPTSKDIEKKADYVISLEWDKESKDDVDIWVRDPLGAVLSFTNRSRGFMFLDRDDLGIANDFVKLPNGKTKLIKLNREVVTLRGTVPGWYTVNVHYYFNRGEIFTQKGKVEIVRINPYGVVSSVPFELEMPGDEKTLYQFQVDEDGVIVNFRQANVALFGRR